MMPSGDPRTMRWPPIGENEPPMSRIVSAVSALSRLRAPSSSRPFAGATLALVFALACVALSACGKGGYVVTTTGSSSARASGSSTAPAKTSPALAPSTARGRHSPSSPSSPSTPTRAQALAFAHAVNLTAADVPGFTPSSRRHSSSPSERRLEGRLRSCLGSRGASALGASSGAVAEASSPEFELHRGIVDLSVASEVSVAHSSAEATAALAAIRSSRVRACLSAYIRALLYSQHYGDGARVSEVTLDSGTPPAPGASGGFGWQVRATLALHGVDLPFYIDILGFVYGPAQVTLTSTGAVRAFPAAAQEELFHTLLMRARSHSL